MGAGAAGARCPAGQIPRGAAGPQRSRVGRPLQPSPTTGWTRRAGRLLGLESRHLPDNLDGVVGPATVNLATQDEPTGLGRGVTSA